LLLGDAGTTVTVSNLSPETGVTGSDPFTLDDTSNFFNEQILPFPLGDSLSFTFTIINLFDGDTPDSFAFYIDYTNNFENPEVFTDAPTTSNTIFFIETNGGADVTRSVYNVDPSGNGDSSTFVTPTLTEVSNTSSTPEPSTALLAGVGAALLVFRARAPRRA
jgi:hypothetical protein